MDGKPHRVQVSVNGTFVKMYVDGRRVINDPDGVRRPVKLIGVNMGTPNREDSDKVMFTNFRLAHGGKDVLKAESLPTLKMILGLLKDDPGLKFSIEGHTDNQGNKEINRPLPEAVFSTCGSAFPRRLREKQVEDLLDVLAPAFRARPLTLPLLVLLEGEDFLEPVVAFPAFVSVGGQGTSSFPGGSVRTGSVLCI